MRQSVPGNSFATLRDGIHAPSRRGAGRINRYFMQRAAYIGMPDDRRKIPQTLRRAAVLLAPPPHPSFCLTLSLSTLEHLPPLSASVRPVIAARPRELIRTIGQARFFAVYLLVRKHCVCVTNAIKVSGVKYVHWTSAHGVSRISQRGWIRIFPTVSPPFSSCVSSTFSSIVYRIIAQKKGGGETHFDAIYEPSSIWIEDKIE